MIIELNDRWEWVRDDLMRNKVYEYVNNDVRKVSRWYTCI